MGSYKQVKSQDDRSRPFRSQSNFASPTEGIERFYSSVVVGFVVFGDILGASMRRGRVPADNSDVMAMFRLVYSGEGATEPLVDDFS